MGSKRIPLGKTQLSGEGADLVYRREGAPLPIVKILGAHRSVATIERLPELDGACARDRPVSAAVDPGVSASSIIQAEPISPSVFDVPVSTHVPSEKTRMESP